MFYGSVTRDGARFPYFTLPASLSWATRGALCRVLLILLMLLMLLPMHGTVRLLERRTAARAPGTSGSQSQRTRAAKPESIRAADRACRDALGRCCATGKVLVFDVAA
jgi:hypothetical protein